MIKVGVAYICQSYRKLKTGIRFFGTPCKWESLQFTVQYNIVKFKFKLRHSSCDIDIDINVDIDSKQWYFRHYNLRENIELATSSNFDNVSHNALLRCLLNHGSGVHNGTTTVDATAWNSLIQYYWVKLWLRMLHFAVVTGRLWLYTFQF